MNAPTKNLTPVPDSGDSQSPREFRGQVSSVLMKTYDASDLKDDRWKLKREKILNYADHRCQACGAEQIPLQVHHSYYRDGLKAWEYPDGSLIALCHDCHGRIIHGIKELPNFEGRMLMSNHREGESLFSVTLDSMRRRFRGGGDDNQPFPVRFSKESFHSYCRRVSEWFRCGIDERDSAYVSLRLVERCIKTLQSEGLQIPTT